MGRSVPGDSVNCPGAWPNHRELDMNNDTNFRAALSVVIAAAMLALAGCGGGTTSSTTSGAATAAGGGDKPLTMTEVEAKAGCTDAKAGDVQVGTKEAAICTVGGHDVYLYTFGDDTARDNWLKIAKSAGALGTFQQGTSWVAQTM